MIHIIFSSLFLITYLVSAAVQYNDPDGWLWIIVYLAATGMCICSLCKRLPRWYALALLTVSLVWIGMLLPAIVDQVSIAQIFESISMKTQSVEQAREIGGLALVAIGSATLLRFK